MLMSEDLNYSSIVPLPLSFIYMLRLVIEEGVSTREVISVSHVTFEKTLNEKPEANC